MNWKQIVGGVVLVLGIVVIAFSFHYKNVINEAKHGMKSASKTFSRNPFGGKMEEAMEEKADYYLTIINYALAGGVVLVVAGGSAFILCKKKRRK